MKKLLSTVFLISILAITMFPLAVSADDNKCTMNKTVTVGDLTCTAGEPYNRDDPENGVCCVLNSLYNISDWIFVLLVALAGIFIVLGAMQIIMAGGDSAKVTTGRNYIMYAAIGLLVGFLAKAIPSLVVMVIK